MGFVNLRYSMNMYSSWLLYIAEWEIKDKVGDQKDHNNWDTNKQRLFRSQMVLSCARKSSQLHAFLVDQTWKETHTLLEIVIFESIPEAQHSHYTCVLEIRTVCQRMIPHFNS